MSWVGVPIEIWLGVGSLFGVIITAVLASRATNSGSMAVRVNALEDRLDTVRAALTGAEERVTDAQVRVIECERREAECELKHTALLESFRMLQAEVKALTGEVRDYRDHETDPTG